MHRFNIRLESSEVLNSPLFPLREDHIDTEIFNECYVQFNIFLEFFITVPNNICLMGSLEFGEHLNRGYIL
jgi:hypothetical protein